MLIRSEIAASVWQVQVEVGDTVTIGDELMILESMKMEIPVGSPVSGRVASIHVGREDIVGAGDPLIEVV